MAKDVIFGLVGGLGIFIYGMYIMSDSLKQLTLNRLKSVLEKITSNRFKGVLVGTGVTALIQSSSATSVILIGFLNAGLITLGKAIPVILGANIGTTITAQLIAFKLTSFAPVFAALGAFVFFFAKKNKIKKIGIAILGFGLLFMGLSMMSGAVKPLAGSEAIKNLFVQFGSYPILGIILGVVITVLLQSSSTTIGIVIALAIAGLIDFKISFFLILGDNIGTCITAIIASFNGKVSSKQLALGHTMFNVIGTIIAWLTFPIYAHFIPMISPGDLTRQIANVHTSFNVINTILFLPFIAYYTKLIKKLIKGNDYEQKEALYLDKNLISTPPLALSAVKKEMGIMLDLAEDMLKKTKSLMNKFDHKKFQEVQVDEESIDKLYKSVSNYLIEVTRKELSDNNSEYASALLNGSKDIERVCDRIEKIALISNHIYEDDIVFSENAKKDLRKFFNESSSMLAFTKDGLLNSSKKSAMNALTKMTEIEALLKRSEKNHISRMKKGECMNVAGYLFGDILIHFERINKHLENIAEKV